MKEKKYTCLTGMEGNGQFPAKLVLQKLQNLEEEHLLAHHQSLKTPPNIHTLTMPLT